MTYRSVAIVSVIVSVVYGVAALIVPNDLGSVFGITFDRIATYEARLLGAAYLSFGIVNFLTKDTAELLTRRAVAAGNAFAWAVSFVLSAAGEVQGLSNAIGWSTVGLAFVFTVLWAWTYAAARERGPEAKRVPAR